MIEGVKMLRDIINQPSFKDLWNTEMVPGLVINQTKKY